MSVYWIIYQLLGEQKRREKGERPLWTDRVQYFINFLTPTCTRSRNDWLRQRCRPQDTPIVYIPLANPKVDVTLIWWIHVIVFWNESIALDFSGQDCMLSVWVIFVLWCYLNVLLPISSGIRLTDIRDPCYTVDHCQHTHSIIQLWWSIVSHRWRSLSH